MSTNTTTKPQVFLSVLQHDDSIALLTHDDRTLYEIRTTATLDSQICRVTLWINYEQVHEFPITPHTERLRMFYDIHRLKLWDIARLKKMEGTGGAKFIELVSQMLGIRNVFNQEM